MPHYRDVPVHTLTHLETRPRTRLCSLQLCQRSLYPITPVHTHAEFLKFKQHVLDPLFGVMCGRHIPKASLIEILTLTSLLSFGTQRWKSKITQRQIQISAYITRYLHSWRSTTKSRSHGRRHVQQLWWVAVQLLWSHCGNFLHNLTILQYCMHGHSLITAIVSKVSIQINRHFLIESDLRKPQNSVRATAVLEVRRRGATDAYGMLAGDPKLILILHILILHIQYYYGPPSRRS
jgi:hypothetical protein